MYKTCAIVPAAGSGIRMGSVKPKQFLHLAGKPLLAYTLSALSDSALISNIILVVAEGTNSGCRGDRLRMGRRAGFRRTGGFNRSRRGQAA